jgi:hypothetical protein
VEWPKSRTELEELGWTFERRTRCKGEKCRKEIEFWKAPAGQWIPLEQIFKNDPNTLVRHHKFCTDVEQFKQSKQIEEPSPKLKKQQAAVKQRIEKNAQRSLF